MTSLEHQPNNQLSYLKLVIKLALSCFFLSVLVLGSVKFLSRKQQATQKTSLDNQVISETNEGSAKSIEDFEKSGLLKGLFNKEKTALPEPPKLPSNTAPNKENEISNQEKDVHPEQTPNSPEQTILPVTTPESTTQVPDSAMEISNKIFDFDERGNYQVKIANYIAKQKIANLNAEELATIIITESQAIKLNPIVTTLLISLESQFNRYSENSNGRVGLLQIHPNEAKLITKKIDLPFLGAVSLYHPIYNIRLGLQLLVEKKGESTWEEAIKKFSKLGKSAQADQYLEKIIIQTGELSESR